MSEENETILEMPDSLLKNPPKPKRKDIADLFSKLVSEEKNCELFKKASKVKCKETLTFYFENTNERNIKIYRGSNLYGIINTNDYLTYISIQKIIWYLYAKKNRIIVKSPYKSKILKIILNWIAKKNIEKLEISIESIYFV